MRKPSFESVVTRLRDEFLASDQKGEEGDLARKLNALPLGVAEMLKFFLHPDGRMIAYNLFFDEVTAEFTETRDVAFGLKLGSEYYPELAELMPDRPPNASDCAGCLGTGWATAKDHSRYACGDCHGCGWHETCDG